MREEYGKEESDDYGKEEEEESYCEGQEVTVSARASFSHLEIASRLIDTIRTHAHAEEPTDSYSLLLRSSS